MKDKLISRENGRFILLPSMYRTKINLAGISRKNHLTGGWF